MYLWACDLDLQLTLLLKDDLEKQLDRNSYFGMLKVSDNQMPNAELKQTSHLHLLCSAGKNKRTLNLYKMPLSWQKSAHLSQKLMQSAGLIQQWNNEEKKLSPEEQ